MTTDIPKKADADLELFFEALRDEAAEPSADLLARVLDDAYAEQDALAAQAVPQTPAALPLKAPAPGLLRSLWDAIGGWPAAAGLVTATVAGIWIGYNPPAAFDSITLAFLDNSNGISLGETLGSFADLPVDG